MNFVRNNTISLDFSKHGNLSILEMHMFIKEKLLLKEENVVSIGVYGQKVLIKLTNSTLLTDIFDKFGENIEYTDAQGNKFIIPVRNESERLLVKIHRIPIEVPDEEIKKVLAQFGSIEELKNDKWRNLPFSCYNDTKLVRMILRKPIPSYITIGAKQYWTTYIGQPRTCRRCNSEKHEAKDCSYSPSNRISNRRWEQQYPALRVPKNIPLGDHVPPDNFSILKGDSHSKPREQEKEGTTAAEENGQQDEKEDEYAHEVKNSTQGAEKEEENMHVEEEAVNQSTDQRKRKSSDGITSSSSSEELGVSRSPVKKHIHSWAELMEVQTDSASPGSILRPEELEHSISSISCHGTSASDSAND